MYSISIPVFARMLANLDHILDKANEHIKDHNWEESALLNARLYPDMFPMVRQVQLATDRAMGAAARLSGIDVPKFENTESSIGALQSRIARAIAFIESVDENAIDASADREITIPTSAGPLTMGGHSYLLNTAMSNFYFHVTTAYAIARHAGVGIGKRDFLG